MFPSVTLLQYGMKDSLSALELEHAVASSATIGSKAGTWDQT